MSVSMYFGNIGCGKSSILAMCASKAKKRGYSRVFSNVPIKDTILIKSSEIGFFDFSDCLLLIDEGGIDFNNRSYKSMRHETIEFLKLSRHYHCDIVIVSQSWDDVDITFRRLVDKLYFIRKILPWVSVYRPIRKRVGIDDESKQIIDCYEIVKFSFRFVWLPRYWSMFDSFSAPSLPPYPSLLATPSEALPSSEGGRGDGKQALAS